VSRVMCSISAYCDVHYLLFVFMLLSCSFFFLFNHPSTTYIYTLSLHDALPISIIQADLREPTKILADPETQLLLDFTQPVAVLRSEEHTSELQSHLNLVCRLLLEKKKNKSKNQKRH